MKNLYCAAAVLLSLAVVVGCSGKPKGFPKVTKCEIVVVDGGTPIEGVEVSLFAETPINGALVGGKTDANGNASFRGFYGSYELEITVNGETVKKTVDLSKKSDNRIKITL